MSFKAVVLSSIILITRTSSRMKIVLSAFFKQSNKLILLVCSLM